MSGANFVYLSKERLLEIEEELKELKTVRRKEVAEKIATARAHGDLSENAEYDAAKEEQGMLEAKISQMEEMLSKAQIVDESKLSKDKVGILSKVKVKNLKVNKEFTYKMVSPEEADFAAGKIAVSSPVGQGLMGKKKGDIAKVKAPAGLIEFEILEIL